MLDHGRCANCDRTIDGAAQKFCPACGQPTPAHRIDWHFLGHELEHSVLHMDRGILYTLKSLMLRPGHLIRDYIHGQRAHHVKPLLLIMTTAAVVVFITQYFFGGNVMGLPIYSGVADATREGGNKFDPALILKASQAVNDWMNHHFAAMTLLLLPLEAAAFKLAFLRFRNLNYPEWLVITAFITAQSLLIWGLFIPLQRWFPGVISWVLLLTVAYGIFSLVQFFADQPRWKSMLRAMLGFGMYMIISSGLAFVLTVALLIMSHRA